MSVRRALAVRTIGVHFVLRMCMTSIPHPLSERLSEYRFALRAFGRVEPRDLRHRTISEQASSTGEVCMNRIIRVFAPSMKDKTMNGIVVEYAFLAESSNENAGLCLPRARIFDVRVLESADVAGRGVLGRPMVEELKGSDDFR